MALNRSDKSRILRRYFPGMTRNSEMSTEPSTFQEFLDRRRAVTVAYLPLYLAEHQWRYNHRSEPVIDQLQAFIRNAHDVVLRGDGKPGDPLEVESMLAVQLALHPPHSGAEKARNRERRSRLAKKEVVQQLRLQGF